MFAGYGTGLSTTQASISIGVATATNQRGAVAISNGSGNSNRGFKSYDATAIGGATLAPNDPPLFTATIGTKINLTAFSASGVTVQPAANITGQMFYIVLGS